MTVSTDRIPTKFNLPADVSQRLAEEVPAGKRSRFVAAAIQKALQEEALRRVLALLENPPLHDTQGPGAVETLQQVRRGHAERLAERHKTLSQ